MKGALAGTDMQQWFWFVIFQIIFVCGNYVFLNSPCNSGLAFM